MAARGTINWTHLGTLVAVAILVGTEVVGVSWAAGWALGGIFQFGGYFSMAIEILFIVIGFAALWAFMRVAVKHEPIRH